MASDFGSYDSRQLYDIIERLKRIERLLTQMHPGKRSKLKDDDNRRHGDKAPHREALEGLGNEWRSLDDVGENPGDQNDHHDGNENADHG